MESVGQEEKRAYRTRNVRRVLDGKGEESVGQAERGAYWTRNVRRL